MSTNSPFGSQAGFSVPPRQLVHQETITVPTTTAVTLASLITGAAIPAGAKSCELQAIGGPIRLGLTAGTSVTTATGIRLPADQMYAIYSDLASVTVVSEGAAVLCEAVFFDRAL